VPAPEPESLVLRIEGGASDLIIAFDEADRCFARCACRSDEAIWQEAFDFIDAILQEDVVALSYWREHRRVGAALVTVEELIIRHGHRREPNRARVRSFRGARNDDVLLESLPEMVIGDSFGFEVLRYRAPPGREELEGAALSGASLYCAELVGLNLSGADLYWAGLRDCNFSRAKLIGADLRGATLHNANLRDADLRRANLLCDNLGGSTDLHGADLRGARLEGTNLRGAVYTRRTRFPEGFDPERAGMILASD